VVLVRQGPQGKQRAGRKSITLLQIMQEVRSICKTRNRLINWVFFMRSPFLYTVIPRQHPGGCRRSQFGNAPDCVYRIADVGALFSQTLQLPEKMQNLLRFPI